jgi:hypothetical protein
MPQEEEIFEILIEVILLYLDPKNIKVVNKYILVTLFAFFSIHLSGQQLFDVSLKKNKGNDPNLTADNFEWCEGSIMLNDGTELKGLVKYNSRNGILSYEDGQESKVFTPLRVAGFEFFDERFQKQRIFYTFKYEDSETNVERPLFFEFLKDYKNFAVLSKLDRIDIGEKSYTTRGLGPNGTYSGYSINRTEISQSETIYLMKNTGEIKPYFKVTVIEDGARDLFTQKDAKTMNKMIDRDLLEEYMDPSEYQKLVAYAKTHNLSFKRKDDFLNILCYYELEVIK